MCFIGCLFLRFSVCFLLVFQMYNHQQACLPYYNRLRVLWANICRFQRNIQHIQWLTAHRGSWQSLRMLGAHMDALVFYTTRIRAEPMLSRQLLSALLLKTRADDFRLAQGRSVVGL